MPFTSKPSSRAEVPSATSRAVNRVIADQGSADSVQHTAGEIKIACLQLGCGALVNERCTAERYPSGKVRVFYPGGFHDYRVLAAIVMRAKRERDRAESQPGEAKGRLVRGAGVTARNRRQLESLLDLAEHHGDTDAQRLAAQMREVLAQLAVKPAVVRQWSSSPKGTVNAGH